MKKLNPQEIDRTVARIREEYDHYIVHFGKTPERKRAFEDRWIAALRRGGDPTRFLGAEIRVVQELLGEAQKEEAAGPPPEVRPARRGSYADRLIEELQRRIRGYPSAGLPAHPELSPDVDKLYGTLDWVARQVWPHVYGVLRAKDPDPRLGSLDQELTALVPWQGRLPKEVEAYVALYRTRAAGAQVAKAQNRCLWLGAAFLHKVADRLADAGDAERDWSREAPQPTEVDLIRRTHGLVVRILDDFRLNALKPREEASHRGRRS